MPVIRMKGKTYAIPSGKLAEFEVAEDQVPEVESGRDEDDIELQSMATAPQQWYSGD